MKFSSFNVYEFKKFIFTGSRLTVHVSLFHFRLINKEIDFLCKKGHQNEYLIQVCYDTSKPATLKREISALTEASLELNPENSLLLTWNDIPRLADTSIIALPVWKWLLA
ncbi:MAG: hypothetical protein NTY96_07295 [Bacteroidetes bacterium]|nr:hypothetical protein [Bacteroidota bacterium]